MRRDICFRVRTKQHSFRLAVLAHEKPETTLKLVRTTKMRAKRNRLM